MPYTPKITQQGIREQQKPQVKMGGKRVQQNLAWTGKAVRQAGGRMSPEQLDKVYAADTSKATRSVSDPMNMSPKEQAGLRKDNAEKIQNSIISGEVYTPAGFDQTQMGVGEQYAQGNQGAFTGGAKAAGAQAQANLADPQQQGEQAVGALAGGAFQQQVASGATAGQSYWKGVQGAYAPGGPGYVGAAHQSFNANVDPGLESYYDQAFKQAAAGMNNELAARGQYGSSAGMQQIGLMGVNLAADRANREADYRLRRQEALTQSAAMASGDERAWIGEQGQLAFQAGNEDLAYRNFGVSAGATGQQLGMARQGQNFEQGLAMDEFGLGQASAGMQAMSMAQQLRGNRLQDAFANQLQLGDRANAGYNAYIDSMIGGNAGVADVVMGKATDQYNRDEAQAMREAQMLSDAGSTLTTLASSYGGGGGNYGGGFNKGGK